MLTIKRRFEFDAAHHLNNYTGACSRCHGHRYVSCFELSRFYPEYDKEKDNGILADMVIIKRVINRHIISLLDHQDLNNIIAQPTAENIVEWMSNRFWEIPNEEFGFSLRLESIELFETPNASVVWRRDVHA